MTPYALKRVAEVSVLHFWSLPHSQIYAECSRLAESGHLSEKREREGRRRRIYRLTVKGAKPAAPFTLKDATPEKLAATLKNDNLFWRLHAQRLLVERGKRDVVPALTKLASDPAVDEIGLGTGAIHALWTLHGLGAVEATQDAAKDVYAFVPDVPLDRAWTDEKLYERAMTIELKRRGHEITVQKSFPVFYRGELTEEILAQTETLAKNGRNRHSITRMHSLRGDWHLARDEPKRSRQSQLLGASATSRRISSTTRRRTNRASSSGASRCCATASSAR